jgi:hypothetical protein
MSRSAADLEAFRERALDELVTVRDAFILRHQVTMRRALRRGADAESLAVGASAA